MGKNIETVKDFQTSINIDFDLYDDKKIESFIPTLSSIKLIEELLLSVNSSSTQRAKILVGAYGKGKSHIVLVALSLLFKKDKRIFSRLLEKIKRYNEDMYEFINSYLESDEKILPVIISGNGNSLSQAFLLGLQKTLKNENLEDFMPDTNYHSVLSTIKNWEENYPDTYEKLKKRLATPIDEFILKIGEYDIDEYRRFDKIYPELTSGSVFNPFTNANIVELYEKVALTLNKRGYSGIYVVYDEFSKYLEGSIENTEINEIKLLQDFAEKCNRSEFTQLHLLLISHKEIANYFSRDLSKEKIDAWRGVSGRFLEVTLQNNFEQVYEVIGEVIKKEDRYWKEFQKKFEKDFEELEKNEIVKKNLIRECYPLHPLSVFILPRISEKVAQNERTLFTFLSAQQRFSLNDYLNKSDENKFALLTPEYIFNYFDPLLKRENYNSEIYKNYKLLKNVLTKVEENSLEDKILKTIALIYFVEQYEKLAPTQDTIVEIFKFDYPTEEILKSLKKLEKEECLIYLKLSNNYLKIKESSGVDIEKQIVLYTEKYLNRSTVVDLLNGLEYNNYLYPTRYNDENEIVRYFDFIFITSSDIYSNRYLNIKNSESDGVAFGVLPSSQEDREKVIESIKNLRDKKEMVFVVPRNYKSIVKNLYRYKSVEELKNLSEEDRVLKEEYELIFNDLQEIISAYIDSFLRPERAEAEYFYLGERKEIYRKAHLSNLLSQICEDIYYKTPIINNETINKNSLSKQTINSRDKIIERLLQANLDENLGLKGSGQEVSIARTLLFNTGILYKNSYNYLDIKINIENEKLKNVLLLIESFLTQKCLNQWKNLSELYDNLILSKNNIGLKKGVIPILLTLFIHKYRKNIIIKYEDKEQKIDVGLINKIDENPEKTLIYLENLTDEKEKYLEDISKIFEEYYSSREIELNNFKYQVFTMKQWYLSLPKFTKEVNMEYLGDLNFENISKEKREFLNSLKGEIQNPREYLLEKVFKIFGYDSFNGEVIEKLRECKSFYENFLENLEEKLIKDIIKIFGKITEIGIISILKNWEEDLNEKTKEHIFNKCEDKFLKLISESGNNERSFIEKLTRLVTALRIEDWNKDIIERFLKELKEMKLTIEEFDKNLVNNSVSENNSYRITFISDEGNEQIRSFDKIDCSRRANLLYNDILSSIDEMGESISEQEIRQILIDILKDYC